MEPKKHIPENTKGTPWLVLFSGKTRKQKEALPEWLKPRLQALKQQLEFEGPEARNWPHYGKLLGKGKKTDFRHCHLNKNKPIYVVIWAVIDIEKQIMEVKYVGTHENANYRKIGRN